MALKDTLEADVKKIFADAWTTRKGIVVPESGDIGLANDSVTLEGTVLYADLDGSTNLVDQYTAEFSAEVYKVYLNCAAKIIRAEGGVITAYDGDRIMAVYIGDTKNTNAARTGLKINYAVEQIINPALKKQYPSKDYKVKQVVGIDTCSLLVARTGIRGSNDLVWVGHAANHAAKMAALSPAYPTKISKAVYDVLNSAVKTPGNKTIWQEATWNGKTIYRSDYEWTM
ncbi:MAG: adenylate/guanylate cyclase domain-containing protein [Hymenobacter sp.]|nr:MAG: adenylate/guanylate cyclase domain-containing protein [Hymenobacter sp.]